MTSELSPQAQADALMFAERAEHKYFLRPDRARAFVDGLETELEVHHFRGQGSNPLPRPVHYVTTLYFDSATHEIARACEQNRENVKLRAREYYDEHPDLTELATRRSEVRRRSDEVWLEVKTRRGAATRKVRFSLPTSEVSAFLSEGVISEASLAAQRETWGEEAEEVFREIGELCMAMDGPLIPSCLAHYRRRAWQDEGAQMRVTLDTRLSFHRAPADMFSQLHSLRKVVAGEPVERFDQYLVEIKLRGGQPPWLLDLVRECDLVPARRGDRPFSKFLAASTAVHGRMSGDS